jgi:hypothetical protein
MGRETRLTAWPFFIPGFLAVVFACATEPYYPAGPLAGQLLRPRKGYVGRLTNQGADPEGKRDVLEYDLRTDPGRKQLHDVRIRCRVGSRLFRVCVDRPGLCEQDEKVTRWPNTSWGIVTKREIVVVDYIDAVDGYQRLLDSGTLCAAMGSPTYRRLFP